MGDKKDPPEVNYVHQTAIHVETINKENFHQKLYTNYSVNPNKKCKFFIEIFFFFWILKYI